MKQLALPTLALVLVGAGCVTPPAPTIAHFSDPAVGVAFDYPIAWGEPKIEEETGRRGMNECTYQIGVLFPELGDGAIVLTAASTDGCDVLGRGAYWGDRAPYIVPDAAYKPPCETGGEDVCDTFQTKSGLTVRRRQHASYDVPYEGGTFQNLNEYTLFHEGHPPSGIMISEERLLTNGQADQTDELRALVESISFVK